MFGLRTVVWDFGLEIPFTAGTTGKEPVCLPFGSLKGTAVRGYVFSRGPLQA